ncbi:hypothetical protein [Pyrococcus kukulkanii]|uniref:hypothetical protein n=2 Tax=Pyrococcus kukulkanii TaxID=1609559 RepID=UPI003566DDA5
MLNMRSPKNNQNCSKFVEYPVPEDLSHEGWESTKWGQVHPEKNITIVLILRVNGRWEFNLTGCCSYINNTLFLKFNATKIPEENSEFRSYSRIRRYIRIRRTSLKPSNEYETKTVEGMTEPLVYETYLWILPKVVPDRIVAYIREDINREIVIHLD